MADTPNLQENPVTQFWDNVKDVHAVMLGTPNCDDHMQPMAPNAARDENAIWFFTSKNTDLARKTQSGGSAHLCLVSKNHQYHACASGDLEVVQSKEHIDRFWSPVVAAWFPDGKSDPDLTMLRFTPKDAKVWASTGSTLRFGFQIAMANVTGKQPDVGDSAHIIFPANRG